MKRHQLAPQPPTHTTTLTPPHASLRTRHSDHPLDFTLERDCLRARLSLITRGPRFTSCPVGNRCNGVNTPTLMTLFLAIPTPCAEGASYQTTQDAREQERREALSPEVEAL